MLGVTRKGENAAESKIPISAYLENTICSLEEIADLRKKVQIELLTREETIIQKAIKEETIQAELKAIAGKLKKERELDIYTDGSLANGGIGDSSKKVMGIGWVLARKDINSIENISFSSRLADWPSSTHAELDAIWTAVLVVPCNTKINIFSDSKVAIEGLQNDKPNNSLCELFKIKNRSLIRQIKDCCKAKELELNLTKVKRHSEDFWNDRADNLAKKDLNSDRIIRVDDVNTDKLRALPRWKDNLIDYSIRSFVNITIAIIYEAEWAELSNSKDIAYSSTKSNNA